ncbi:PhzF family phenazine biosynthesis protein [Pseudomonas sp. sp1636]|uniref:PhzF family phenazine biosynthesis protein n=1 Tax=Pseudomonas sp. sp1636 TaxID=3036707 RepID=UPI0025A65FD8|nr:PhzF family phenazine biosynthesis protein [Pseudomonas sp. sp1636]MDM8350526.1 PhzF family phenazine biosynthesis protein [Pseudomonas sp. sp1636]
MQIDVQLVNAFVDGEAGGNPAGVVLDADNLEQSQKLAIAAALGLSETAFVSSSEKAAFKLEFFTPSRQIAHCGHATIATFSLLRQLGRVGEGWTSKETIDGNRDILIAGEMAFMQQLAPRYRDIDADLALFQEVLAALRIDAQQLMPAVLPSVVNTGNGFLIVPLRDEAAVAGLKPDQALLERLSEQLDLIGFYVFSRQVRVAGRDAGARMFAPRYGIEEEAATGMAAGPLACFLRDRLGLTASRLLIEQGWLMPAPSPSLITVDLQVGEAGIEGLLAGGTAQVMRSTHVRL